MSESRIKAAVDRGVREALASPEFAESVDQYTQATTPMPEAPQAPAKPLHEMSPEEWDAHRRTYWEAAMPTRSRTLTISDLIGRRYDGDEA
ncbi:MAG: hypothetical protein JF597_23100 [Streptomyces sp.]|jgi:hypothetical protein|uniref:hypothetical protein n=1 Tax=Streptomyces sp. TaxID=1931 RepID=UPI0025F927D4|nr:hypothetical protein [Streptomyces sp.]MBW8796377.1 hypothetical protein [Streptomyces sp.]